MFANCAADGELTFAAVTRVLPSRKSSILLSLCLAAVACSRTAETDLEAKQARGTEIASCAGSKPPCGQCSTAVCNAPDWSCEPKAGGTFCTGTHTQCTTNQCDGAGACAQVPLAAGTVCNDGDVCTYSDKCNGAGGCAGTPITCTGTVGCYSLFCNGTATCGQAPLQAGTLCTDSNNCTFNDRCDGNGTCNGTPISLCSTTTCGSGGCNAVVDLVDTIRVDATGKGLVTFKSALWSHGACCTNSASCNPASLAFDASTPGGEGVLALVTAAKLGGQKINAIGKGTCAVYPGPSGTVSEDWTYGTLVP